MIIWKKIGPRLTNISEKIADILAAKMQAEYSLNKKSLEEK